MKKLAFIILILCVVNFAFAKYHIVVVAGQSNCLNIHTRATALPSCEGDSLVPFFYDLFYPPSFAPNDLVTSSDDLWETLHVHERETNTGPTYPFFGPEITLARTLSEHMDSIAIFKYGVAGSNLAYDWGLSGDQGSQIFDKMVVKMRLAETAMIDSGLDFEWTAFTWMQGESDAARSDYATDYYRNLGYLMKLVRDTLHVENLPFVVGAIADELRLDSYPYREKVMEAQVRRTNADDHALLVNTADYSMDTDNVHFNSQGVMDLGVGFAEAILELTTETATSSLHPFESMDFVYPNPVNGTVKIEFPLGMPLHIKLVLYDINGRRLVLQDHGILEAKYQKLSMDLNNYPSGLYILSIVAGDFVYSEKISLLK